MRKGMFAAVLLAGVSANVEAAIVVDTLPFAATNDWTRGAMNGGNTGFNSAGEAVLTTNPGAGNWFGWGTFYQNVPSWTPGNSAAGNYLNMRARFGDSNQGSIKDFSAYFYDASHAVFMAFNPTGCDGNAMLCYNVPARKGVELTFATGNVFVDMDIEKNATYEFLLKDGIATYRINGRSYSGAALAANVGFKLLVIGDGSGGTQTGQGTMVLSRIGFDNAPTFDALPALVPEPAAWAMMIAGFGLAGTAARRRKSAPRALA